MNACNIVGEYLGINFNEVLDLPHDIFLLSQRNALIKTLSRSNKGRESLRLWQVYKTTEPDYGRLRELGNYTVEGGE